MHLLYTSYYFSSYQKDADRCFYIDFGHKMVKFSFCQLLSLRNKLNKINLDAHFDDQQKHQGMKILSLCNREHVFVFDTLQLYDLKQLLKATFGMFELQALLSQP